ncbi:GNL3L/Grn1 GTPase [Cardiosporidium cionae]|uniref:GNL3L/Grn1 GTPase n=1 Tax=Cardiosporidium cionae TaxID=476202 RepID=A0ABQ7J9Y7_9APIC|nr:GNL3L/Grn1 GTPase [Cardiosporidium cionae]|eukprot:KAF8820786.1 GNL3L/Grn1 GTPase [Cardiosporidium cionae]
MAKLQKTSKRQKITKKFTIDKKAKAHKRKMKKETKAKNAQQQPRRKKKNQKDPRIPNICPFKSDLLQQIEQKREQIATQRQAKKNRKREKVSVDTPNSQALPSINYITYETLVDSALSSQKLFEDASQAEKGTLPGGGISKTQYFNEVQKVIDASDIVVEVLDARDPNNCRCISIERKILSQQKKLILLLNKIDLVPKSAVLEWLKYLRLEQPTLAFKAASSSADRAQHCSTSVTMASDDLRKSASTVLGATALIQLFKNYSRSGNTLSSVIVGIIGYPNVGKSSVINSLKRSATAVKVGGEAGITRAMQEIHLDSKIKLLDSPGILFDGSADDPNMILRNTVKLSNIKDPEKVVDALLERSSSEALMKAFNITHFNTTQEFLVKVAETHGKLGKGGVGDILAAARLVLSDWTAGKLKYYSLPPKRAKDENESVTLVEEFDPSLNLDELSQYNESAFLDSIMEYDAIPLKAIEANFLEFPQNCFSRSENANIDAPNTSQVLFHMTTEENVRMENQSIQTLQKKPEIIKRRRRRALLLQDADGLSTAKDVFLPPKRDSSSNKQRPTHRLREEGYNHAALESKNSLRMSEKLPPDSIDDDVPMN